MQTDRSDDGAVREGRPVRFDGLSFAVAELWQPIALTVLVAVLAFGGLVDRPILYDEALTLLVVSGHADPEWPDRIESAAALRSRLEGDAGLAQIAADLQRTDVHPPVYFWCLALWRSVYGGSLEAARAFSTLTAALAVGCLWVLLRGARGSPSRPWLPAAAFALSSGVVYSAQIARPYSLALFLSCLGALFAHRATECSSQRTTERGRPSPVYFLGAAFLFALAISTSYLAIFPAAAGLATLAWRGRGSPGRVLATSIALALAVAPAVFLMLKQMGSRPEQDAGFAGWGTQIRHLARGTLAVIADVGAPWQAAVVLAIGLGAVFLLLRRRSEVDRGLVLLLVGLAVAPLAGLLVLNLAFDKHLHAARYLIFATPGLAPLVAYGLGRSRRWVWLVVPFLLVQWINAPSTGVLGAGGEPPPPRASAGLVSPEPTLAVVGAGIGRAAPATVIHDLPPTVDVLVLDEAEDLAVLEAALPRYPRLLLMRAKDGETAELEERADRLMRRNAVVR